MKGAIGFTKARTLTYPLSFVVIVAMFVVTFVVHGGYNLGLDFQPGASVQILINSGDSSIENVREALANLDNPQIQSFSSEEGTGYEIRVRNPENIADFGTITEKQIRADLTKVFPASSLKIGSTDGLSTNQVGARFSATLATQAIWLVALALVFIMFYIWIRFRLGFAIAAIVATVHDTLFLVGFIGLVQMEVTSATIAAVLTIIGYSLNDTIVVFDRIRENEKTMSDHKLSFIYDSSITSTLSRTMVTSLTTLIAVVSIVIFTQGEIRDFALALIVGIVVGTYSSIFIASPVLLDWRSGENKRKKKKEAKLGGKLQTQAKVEFDGETSVNSKDVDAEALAEEIRRQRAEKKK